jgi:transcriptional regulator with XRE-family HTH domain
MKLGDKIRQLREEGGLTQCALAARSSAESGYLSAAENGEVKNPPRRCFCALPRLCEPISDELFEAAGYPTVRALRQIYQEYQATIDEDLLRYLTRLPRDRQRRLLFLLEGMEALLSAGDNGDRAPAWEQADNARRVPAAAVRTPPLQYTRTQN